MNAMKVAITDYEYETISAERAVLEAAGIECTLFPVALAALPMPFMAFPPYFNIVSQAPIFLFFFGKIKRGEYEKLQ